MDWSGSDPDGGSVNRSAIKPCVLAICSIWNPISAFVLSQKRREAYAMSHCRRPLCSVGLAVTREPVVKPAIVISSPRTQTQEWPKVGTVCLFPTLAPQRSSVWLGETDSWSLLLTGLSLSLSLSLSCADNHQLGR